MACYVIYRLFKPTNERLTPYIYGLLTLNTGAKMAI
jgi:hypothetical protein